MIRHEWKQLFTRRVFIFAGVKFILFSAIISRLTYLQIFRASHYKLLSDKNRLVSKQILPLRGKIFDSTGNLIATNKISYSVLLDMFEIPEDSRENVVNKLISEKKFDKKTLNALANIPQKINKQNRFVILQENVDWDSLANYYILSSSIPGIAVEKTQTRHYTHSLEFAHILGYTGAPNKLDLEKNPDNTSLLMPMVKVGKNGVEKFYNDKLFGKTGIEQVEVNSRRLFVRAIDAIDSHPGEDLHLTINLKLQQEIYELLSQYRSASCVVMDIHNGAILAFVSYPGYDTNIFTKKIDSKTLKEIYQNPYKPIINKITNGLYAPGSTFKMITALAGLNSEAITEYTKFHCSGFYELGNHKFHCWRWKYGGHGPLDVKESLTQSCDVFFYNVAKIIGPETIAKTARDFGLGELTGIDLPNEKSGLIPTKLWKKNVKKHSWTMGDSFNTAIGQGFVLSTPIQLTKMIAMLVNGLHPITPFLVKNKLELDKIAPLKYKEKHIKLVIDGLNDVVNSSRGTARASATNEDDGFDFGGKTGSSQVSRITMKQRQLGQTVSSDYWNKEHAVFVGYAPTEKPRVAVCVLVEHGGGGGGVAAPLARDILRLTKKNIGL